MHVLCLLGVGRAVKNYRARFFEEKIFKNVLQETNNIFSPQNVIRVHQH